jgi:hypothetical protein
MDPLLLWAAPSLIVGLWLSTRFKPSVSFIVTMGVFFLTVHESRIFSLGRLLSSFEGVGFLAAETVAALIITGLINLPRRKRSTF